MNKLIKFLKENITSKTSLEDIINVFEQMCSVPIEEAMILFETGTYDFTGKPMFYISFVRQFPNDEDEYYQIHVDVLYEPARENKKFNEEVWDEDLNENIFDYIRRSRVFAYAKNQEYIDVDIYMDET